MNTRTPASNFIAIAKVTAFLALATSALYSQDSAKAKPLPTAQQVMDHYVNALGGRDSIFKHKAMTVRGKFLEGSDNGPSMDRTVYYKDGKILYEIVLPDGSRYQEGFNGDVAWQLHPKNGPAISEGDEVKSKQRDADMYYPARILDYFSSMDVVEMAEFEGHTCYHLKGTNKWGKVNEQFFDTMTGLLIGYRFNSAWRGGSGDEIEVFSDYKDFGGWLMPTRDTNKSADGTQVQTTTSISFGDVADSVFTLPDSIKALLAKKRKG
jgi:hypothetical protein